MYVSIQTFSAPQISSSVCRNPDIFDTQIKVCVRVQTFWQLPKLGQARTENIAIKMGWLLLADGRCYNILADKAQTIVLALKNITAIFIKTRNPFGKFSRRQSAE